MIIRCYGIDLVRLEEKHIELLRQWRNAPRIVQQMEYQEYITPEMQLRWFEKIDNLHNFYFMIRHGKGFLGMIHLANIDYQDRISEAGLFVGDPEYEGSAVPVYASLATIDFAFEHLKLQYLTAKIKASNQKAKAYNTYLGFERWKPAPTPGFELGLLTQDQYAERAFSFRDMARKMFPEPMAVEFDPSVEIDLDIQKFLQMKRY